MAQTHPHLTPGILACLGGIGLFCRVCSLLAKDLPLRAKWRLDRAAALSGGSTGTSRRRNYLTNYRAGVMVTSAIAILAVDFPVFPRRSVRERHGPRSAPVGLFAASGAGYLSRL